MVDAVPPTHPEPNKASAPDDYEDLVARAFIAMSAGTPQLHLIQNPPGAFHSSAKETASMGIPCVAQHCNLDYFPLLVHNHKQTTSLS
ncbi:hypothetical protein G4B84_009938 [Aspergillus flavus NRRL3357]|nr:uncharacterized protein G4B84_009938 [Aspergillus flavus NRRL3357]QMW34472.1 hypothetical protein G4B84_009938 [Aspergillus flavus NRRL3357]QMW46525.1 hypothetical protein G4B11_009980 [Aspergillus flavus]